MMSSEQDVRFHLRSPCSCMLHFGLETNTLEAWQANEQTRFRHVSYKPSASHLENGSNLSRTHFTQHPTSIFPQHNLTESRTMSGNVNSSCTCASTNGPHLNELERVVRTQFADSITITDDGRMTLNDPSTLSEDQLTIVNNLIVINEKLDRLHEMIHSLGRFVSYRPPAFF